MKIWIWIGLGVAAVGGLWWLSTRGGPAGRSGVPFKLQVAANFFTQPSPDQSYAGTPVRLPAGTTVYIDNDDAQQGEWTPVYLPGRGAQVYWTKTENLIQIGEEVAA